ncbi:MAG: tetratricopeptide repeat protein [Armatimonadota bacterium]|nr:tetratricopeptide repeat protein [Armatimonadota bacterium]
MDDYYNLGAYSRPVTTSSRDAQVWFDRGLLWCYGFHHEESIRCFARAAERDPRCAMAYWGIAYASGSNYNKPWEAFREDELQQALTGIRQAMAGALAHVTSASPVEQALIRALVHRYPPETAAPDAFSAWNDAYAGAMREVYAAFPDDLDVCSLFAEALINRTPWKLWDLRSGRPADGANTLEAVEVLEAALGRIERDGLDPHPGLLHMYVHTMEMSPHPERALRAADTLRDLVPDAGHLRHMPSHIDVLCGHYYDAVIANTKAIAADARYLDREGPINFYTLYRCHNYHFKLYAAMFLGQYRTAIDAANAMVATIPEELLRVESPPMADWLEGFVSTKMHAYIRFGKWDEIMAEPFPPDRDLYCVTTAMQHYARAIACAITGRIRQAETERRSFAEAVARVPDTRYIFNNRCADILAVAAEMLNGELEYRKGNVEPAFAHLRQAVVLDDSLPYDEPWGWMQPARHALGALLLEQGRVAEAERVYRDDLGLNSTLSRASQHPDNVWSLQGLVECLHRQHKHAEAETMQRRLDLAKARADVPIHASCFCRLDVG